MHVSSHIRMFADDCVLYREITNPSDQTALQNDLKLTVYSNGATCG